MQQLPFFSAFTTKIDRFTIKDRDRWIGFESIFMIISISEAKYNSYEGGPNCLATKCVTDLDFRIEMIIFEPILTTFEFSIFL